MISQLSGIFLIRHLFLLLKRILSTRPSFYRISPNTREGKENYILTDKGMLGLAVLTKCKKKNLYMSPIVVVHVSCKCSLQKTMGMQWLYLVSFFLYHADDFRLSTALKDFYNKQQYFSPIGIDVSLTWLCWFLKPAATSEDYSPPGGLGEWMGRSAFARSLDHLETQVKEQQEINFILIITLPYAIIVKQATQQLNKTCEATVE